MASTGPAPTGVGHDRGLSLVVVSWTFCTLSLIFILLRAFVRIKILNSFGLTDIFLFIAMACAITNASLVTVAVHAGLGRHIFDLALKELETTIMYLTFCETMFALSLVFSKMSICLILLHLLQGASGHKKKYFLYFTMGLLVAVSFANIGIQYGLCRPISKSWNPTVPGHCRDDYLQVGNICSNGVMAAFVDFSLAAFPITFIKDLKLCMRKKILLCSLMSIGILAGVCAIIRTVRDKSLQANNDITYSAINASIWGIIEENVSITVACIPVLRPLFSSRQTPHRIPELPPLHSPHHQKTSPHKTQIRASSANDDALPARTDIRDIELQSTHSTSNSDSGLVPIGTVGAEWKVREGW